MYNVRLCRAGIRGMYLRGDEVTNHKGQGKHQHLHTITCHLGILLAINKNVVEMACVCSAPSVNSAVLILSNFVLIFQNTNYANFCLISV